MGHAISRATRLGLQHLVADICPGRLVCTVQNKSLGQVRTCVRGAHDGDGLPGHEGAAAGVQHDLVGHAISRAARLGLQDLVADVHSGQTDLGAPEKSLGQYTPAPEGPMMAMASRGMNVPLQGCSATLWDTRSPEPPALACSTLKLMSVQLNDLYEPYKSPGQYTPAPEGPMMAIASRGMKVPLQGCSTTLWDTRSPEPPALACSTL